MPQQLVVAMELIRADEAARAFLDGLRSRFTVKGPHHFGRFEVVLEDVPDLETGVMLIGAAATEIDPEWAEVAKFVREESTLLDL